MNINIIIYGVIFNYFTRNVCSYVALKSLKPLTMSSFLNRVERFETAQTTFQRFVGLSSSKHNGDLSLLSTIYKQQSTKIFFFFFLFTKQIVRTDEVHSDVVRRKSETLALITYLPWNFWQGTCKIYRVE